MNSKKSIHHNIVHTCSLTINPRVIVNKSLWLGLLPPECRLILLTSQEHYKSLSLYVIVKNFQALDTISIQMLIRDVSRYFNFYDLGL